MPLLKVAQNYHPCHIGSAVRGWEGTIHQLTRGFILRLLSSQYTRNRVKWLCVFVMYHSVMQCKISVAVVVVSFVFVSSGRSVFVVCLVLCCVVARSVLNSV